MNTWIPWGYNLFFLCLSQFLFSLLHTQSPIHAKSTLVRTEESARWSHTHPRSNAPVRRDSLGRSVSTVRWNLPHHLQTNLIIFLRVTKTVFTAVSIMVRDSLAAADRLPTVAVSVLFDVVIELWVSLWSIKLLTVNQLTTEEAWNKSSCF